VSKYLFSLVLLFHSFKNLETEVVKVHFYSELLEQDCKETGFCDIVTYLFSCVSFVCIRQH